MPPTLPKALRALVLSALGLSATNAWADTFTMPPIAGDCSAAARQAEQRLERRTVSKSYGSVRRQFFAVGWQPAPVGELKRIHYGNELVLNGTESMLYDKKYFELDWCAVDHHQPCVFRFKNEDGSRLRVNTSREYNSSSKPVVTVMALQLTCPPSPPDVWVKVQ